MLRAAQFAIDRRAGNVEQLGEFRLGVFAGRGDSRVTEPRLTIGARRGVPASSFFAFASIAVRAASGVEPNPRTLFDSFFRVR